MNSPPVPRRDSVTLQTRLCESGPLSPDTGWDKFPNLFPSGEMGKIKGRFGLSQETFPSHRPWEGS